MRIIRLLAVINIVISILFFSGCKGKGVEQLLEQRRVEAAERRCEKLKDEEKKEGYRKIAAFYLQEEKYKKAADFYARSQEHIKVINSYFQGDYIAEAERYCQGLDGEIKKKCADKLGRKFFLNGQYKKAINYYQLAGNTEEKSYIESQIPFFQLRETLDMKTLEIKDIELNKEIAALKKLIGTYIYLGRLRQWPYPAKSESDKKAAQYHEKALRLLDDQLIPKLRQTLGSDSFDWSKESFAALDFERFKIKSLLDYLSNMHHIADKQEYFSRLAKGYRDIPHQEKNTTSDLLNYDETYMKTLSHARTLLRDLEDAESITDPDLLKDYRNDIGIDNQVIEYIASLLNNLRLRVDDLRKRGLKLKNSKPDGSLDSHADKVYWDFVFECSRVLHLVSKEKYQKANDLLLSGYENAKAALVDIKN